MNKAAERLPRNDGDERPLDKRQHFEYWYVGYCDGREGLPPLGWMKQGWPEDGYEAYLLGHEKGSGYENDFLAKRRRIDRKQAERDKCRGHNVWGDPV